LAQAGDAGGPGLAATEVTDRGIALGADHARGLLPQFPWNGTEGVVLWIEALDVPPGRAFTLVTPEALQPFTIQRQNPIEGCQQLVRSAFAEAPQHQLAHLRDIQMIFRRNAVELLLRVPRTEQFAALGALTFARPGNIINPTAVVCPAGGFDLLGDGIG